MATWSWYSYVPGSNSQRRRRRKEDRKNRIQWEVYYRRLAKWEEREPSRWRILAHWRWRTEKPKMPKEVK